MFMISIHRWFFQTCGLLAPWATLLPESVLHPFLAFHSKSQIWMIANTCISFNISISIIPLSDNLPVPFQLTSTSTQTSFILWYYSTWIFCLPHLLHPHYSSYQTWVQALSSLLCLFPWTVVLSWPNNYFNLNAIHFKLNAMLGLLWCLCPWTWMWPKGNT